MEDDDGIEWIEMMTLPNISMILSLLTFLIAAYVSWTEEKPGEDGLELSDEESSDEENNNKGGQFVLETSIDDGEGGKPKYYIFVAWKWFTTLYQITFIVQIIVIILWGLEDLVPTDPEKGESK